jgi:hypothetical protein
MKSTFRTVRYNKQHRVLRLIFCADNCDFRTEVSSWHCNTVTEHGAKVKGTNLENSEGGLAARMHITKRG